MVYGNDDDVELVRKAQRGDDESLRRLAETARVRLHEYVFRVTLNEDMTQDLVQETILEMLKVFGKLRDVKKFWPWLHGIAFNKVRNHYGKSWRQKTRALSQTGEPASDKPGDDALAQVVTAELQEIVLRSIRELEPRHRAVLTMRCYDRLSYAEIARMTGCSQISARALFYRAKKALARRLSAHGLEKGSLVIALLAFGKMTAASEAAVAQVAIAGATLHVGPTAALAATIMGKVGLVALVTTSALATGSVAIHADRIASIFGADAADSTALPTASWQAESATSQQECWYYFPEGPDKPVMIRLIEFGPSGKSPLCRILQNQYMNYHAGRHDNSVQINSYRAWNPDLSVKRLPTDSVELSAFIAEVEGHASDTELVAGGTKGLLITCRRQGDRDNRIWRIDRHLNVLQEEYFHFSWPESTRIIDRRDAMHKRGWAYFRIHGEIEGTRISGSGRLPFVHASSRRHYPWLKVSVGKDVRIADTPAGAGIYDGSNRLTARHPAGSFFKGLCRPWLGLHSIDTIRRDAAKQRLRFATAYDGDTARATITVYAEPVRLVYTVSMEADVIERITLLRPETRDPEPIGELKFDYLQEMGEAEGEFAAPPQIRSGTASPPEFGMLWLSQLTYPQ